MNVRKRSGLMGGAVGAAAKNAVSSRVDSVTQAKKIPHSVSTPAKVGPSKIRGAVSSPNQS